MRKVWSILLAVLMLISALPLGAFSMVVGAEDVPTTPTIWADHVGGYAGDTVTVNVQMASNPGLAGWLVDVRFDESVLELIGLSKGDAFSSGGSLSFGPVKSPTNALWYDFLAADNYTNNGILFALTFKIKVDAPSGKYPIEVYCSDPDNLCNIDFERVDFDMEDGSVEVYERVAGVALDQSELNLKTGESAALAPIFTPATAYNKAVIWESSAPDVATVSDNGTVTAIKFGTAVITVTTVDGGYTATATVNVTCANHVYGDLTDGYCIDCGTPRTVVRFDLTAPYTRVYAYGDDALDVTGGYVDIAYADGAEGRVDLADATITGYNAAVVGMQTLTVTVGSGSATYDVQVVEGALPTIRVDVDQKAFIGKEITATVRLENNPGLVSMKLSIDYDTTKFELMEIREVDGFDIEHGPLTSPLIVNWVDAISPNNTTNGVFVQLIFKVKDDAVEGPTPITVRYDADDLFDYDLEPVLFNVVNAETDVRKSLPGDLNNDGKVNIRDLGVLQQYLNGWEMTFEESAADLTADGKINIRDLGLLQQYLNGWDIELK